VVENNIHALTVCVVTLLRLDEDETLQLWHKLPPKNDTTVCHSVTMLSYGCIISGQRNMFENNINSFNLL
jgi:hypothetical protein